MKKFLIVFLAIVAVSAIAVSAFVFVPKAVNESQVNKLSSGGAKDGETVFSLNDSFEGAVNMTEDKKIEFCFTEVLSVAGDGEAGIWEYNYIQAKEHLYLIGEYSVGLDKNITIDVEEYYSVLELVGSEQNIANYRDINTKRNKELFESGSRTNNQFDAENTRLSGEKFLPDELAMPNAYISSPIISAKLRFDTENNKVYLLSYQTKNETVEFSYYETGEIKSKTSKLFGTVPTNTIEYDINGKKLVKNSQREFYDNGAIKTQIYESDRITQIYEYNKDGKLMHFSHYQADNNNTYYNNYEYNNEGICISDKRYAIHNDDNRMSYKRDIKYIGYGREIIIEYIAPEFEEKESYYSEFYNYELVGGGELAELNS